MFRKTENRTKKIIIQWKKRRETLSVFFFFFLLLYGMWLLLFLYQKKATRGNDTIDIIDFSQLTQFVLKKKGKANSTYTHGAHIRRMATTTTTALTVRIHTRAESLQPKQDAVFGCIYLVCLRVGALKHSKIKSSSWSVGVFQHFHYPVFFMLLFTRCCCVRVCGWTQLLCRRWITQ